ncbi:hypothetical protein [Vibrio phage vB_VpaS_CHI]|nr:hypothetical protein [Vibrio phage vB_VpaS_ALK]USL90083.1 hypothetical protein [Vibrio phage vB_VpaS_CHI]
MAKQRIFWRGFQPPMRVTPIVDHPDKVWDLTGDAEYSKQRGWKLLRVEEDGTPIKMIGCLGGCAGTSPEWDFTYELVEDASWSGWKTVYTCKSCGGEGTEQDYNYSEDLYQQFNQADNNYKEAKAQMEASWAEMEEIADRLNEDWNRTLSVEDYRV